LEGTPHRYYSLSAEIRRQRNSYYEILERTQKGTLDVTSWLGWFLASQTSAVERASQLLDKSLGKASFWRDYGAVVLNARQRLVLNRLLDGFEGKLTSSKWAKLCKCSQDTASRDIQDLVQKGVLAKSEAGGRSTSYTLSAG
ncbi:MAG TPA: Fic family protein, partial [Myxococcota bacterium]|nr:Fic family protein [Myxococcota bacterium]